MSFKQYIKENDKLAGLKRFIDRLSFKKGHISSWIARPQEYGFEMGGGADDDIEISYINLSKKFGRPLVRLDKQGEGALYYWGIEFKEGYKAIITNVFYYDPEDGYVDLPKGEPVFWEVYTAPFSDEVSEIVIDRLRDILLIRS